MADLDVTSTTTQRVHFAKSGISLDAGEKLADIAEIIAFAQKTVPVGKRVENIRVMITGNVVDV